MVKNITEENFKDTTKSGISIIKFGAQWCGPCRQMAPIIEKLSEEINDMVVGDCDIDESPSLAQELGIRSIPTTIIFNNGEVKDTIIGVETVDQLKDRLNN